MIEIVNRNVIFLIFFFQNQYNDIIRSAHYTLSVFMYSLHSAKV